MYRIVLLLFFVVIVEFNITDGLDNNNKLGDALRNNSYPYNNGSSQNEDDNFLKKESRKYLRECGVDVSDDEESYNGSNENKNYRKRNQRRNRHRYNFDNNDDNDDYNNNDDDYNNYNKNNKRSNNYGYGSRNIRRNNSNSKNKPFNYGDSNESNDESNDSSSGHSKNKNRNYNSNYNKYSDDNDSNSNDENDSSEYSNDKNRNQGNRHNQYYGRKRTKPMSYNNRDNMDCDDENRGGSRRDQNVYDDAFNRNWANGRDRWKNSDNRRVEDGGVMYRGNGYDNGFKYLTGFRKKSDMFNNYVSRFKRSNKNRKDDTQCVSQCVFGYLKVLDDSRVPSETLIIKWLQEHLSNNDLKRIKAVRETRRCFARLSTSDTEDGCEFSEGLAKCLDLEFE